IRDDSTRLLPRISTTVSVGTSTSVISLWRSVSRTRALRLSRTFFSCPEYVCRMNHCFISKLPRRSPSGGPEQLLQLRNQERETLVHDPQVDGEEDDGDDGDDRRVPDFEAARPGDSPQLPARVAYELAGALEGVA